MFFGAPGLGVNSERSFLRSQLFADCLVFTSMNLQLSVLDQAPIRKGSGATEALAESIALAKLTDELGFTRYWVSEHHNTITLAGAAPEVLLARLGAETKRIRLGSGGIMLPNHSSLKVAENFRLLEALYPGRVDLGVGRAPGGDRASSERLNPSNTFDPQEYLTQIREVQDYFNETPSPSNLQGKIMAIPSIGHAPAMWALTSSGESAYIAAHFGLGLSYAQFINPYGGAEAIKIYRERFLPSESLSAPAVNAGIFVFTSESEEKVEHARALFNYRLLSFEKGNFNQLYDYNDIRDYVYTPAEQQRLIYHAGRYIIGTPGEVKNQLTQLAHDLDVNEIIVATFAESTEDRLESYRILASLFLS